MIMIEQGDMLRVGGIQYPVIVVSNNFFNQSGKVIACPIVKNAIEGPLHIKLKDSSVEGIVLCEQVKYLDLKARHYSKLTSTHYFDIMDISDAVMAIFDYQQL
ncbi:MAG: type II toxin-antitoxin system PemK/MazF family toxin [Clostridiales bacterium]|nr:type II toxin-antitoxin system PemK/MazF family toxin [Clostridiales bacterium]